MSMLNTVILQGRLTAEPDIKQTQSGISVCNFSIANELGYGDKKTTQFVPCKAWRNTADFVAKYFHKGSDILIKGEYTVTDYTDKDGTKKRWTEIRVLDVFFIGSKKADTQKADNQETTAPASNTDNEEYGYSDDDDVPF